MKFNPATQKLEPDTPAPVANPLSKWKPYVPPWYPYDNDPWVIISNMSGNVITRYSAWCDSLPPGELHRLIAEHRAKTLADGRESR